MHPIVTASLKLIRDWNKKQVLTIDHRSVVSDIYREGEITAGYFLTLTVANLIALCGLIVNSSPVIIGAMLISPLMGPILSFGYAFITGEKNIWRKSVRKITLSVVVTIIMATIATFLSPLTDLTSEIVSRTRPNLYDLIIAFLAGVAGAGAICTKKNYMTIVPGVAIATAVIPPLSVAGFGAGTASLKIFFGGFLLFFTNFVAIIISTCLVFFFYGFRPTTTDVDLAQLKKRIIYLACVLLVISIPLIYTLHQSISEVRMRTTVQGALKDEVNQAKRSSLSSFTYFEKNGVLEINALVNTVDYMKDAEVKRIEAALTKALGQKVILNLEQVKVQSGGLQDQLTKQTIPVIAPPQPPWEVLNSSRESVVSVIRRSTGKMEKVISPSRIADFTVGFSDKSSGILLQLKISRDTPLSTNEITWLRQMLSADLNLPVDLKVDTVPFIPQLAFKVGETALTDAMKKAVLTAKDIYRSDLDMTVRVEARPERATLRKRRANNQARLSNVVELLVKECGIPRERIRETSSDSPATEGTVRILFLTAPR